jgi:hypothetical protein
VLRWTVEVIKTSIDNRVCIHQDTCDIGAQMTPSETAPGHPSHAQNIVIVIDAVTKNCHGCGLLHSTAHGTKQCGHAQGTHLTTAAKAAAVLNRPSKCSVCCGLEKILNKQRVSRGAHLRRVQIHGTRKCVLRVLHAAVSTTSM